jgi:branched-chain amino acid transport system substrate-binding protein
MGNSFRQVFAEEVVRRSGIVVYEETFEKSSVDFKSLAAKISSKDADCVYLLGYDSNLGILARELREHGVSSTFLSTATISQKPVLESAGEAIEGTYYTSVLFDSSRPQSDAAKMFVEAYKAKYSEAPTYFSAFAYDSLRILAESLDSNSAENSAKRLRLVEGYQGVCGTITVGLDGDCRFPMIVKQLKGGAGVDVN